jgi:hypothetical protein
MKTDAESPGGVYVDTGANSDWTGDGVDAAKELEEEAVIEMGTFDPFRRYIPAGRASFLTESAEFC